HDFFEQRVMDDPEPSVLYDPQLKYTSQDNASSAAQASFGCLDLSGQPEGTVSSNQVPSGRSEGTDAFVPPGHSEEQQAAQPETVVAPRRDVTGEALPELGGIVIRAENPEDLKAILDLIEYIRKEAEKADIQIQLVELKYADATSVVATLNQLFQ